MEERKVAEVCSLVCDACIVSRLLASQLYNSTGAAAILWCATYSLWRKKFV